MQPDLSTQGRSNGVANVDTQSLEIDDQSIAVSNDNENLPSWEYPRSTQTAATSSINFEKSRRWFVSYQSIELLAVIGDILIIFSAGVLAETVYRLIARQTPDEMTKYAAAAAVFAALFIPSLKGRDLYKPTALLSWFSQVRAVTTAWIVIFMFLAGCVFALKIGSTFSRGAIVAFATIGLAGLVVHRTFWRMVLEDGLESKKWSGRTIVLISETSPASDLERNLLRHGLRV